MVFQSWIQLRKLAWSNTIWLHNWLYQYVSLTICQPELLTPDTRWAMPRCYGLPAGECPLKKNDVTVTLRQGDMMLCQSCCDTRFGGNKEEDKNTRHRQTDRYFIDRKKVNPDLFVIELEICTCIYNIVNLLKSYDNIHSMSYTTKIMLTGIAIRNTGYVL